MGIHFGTVEESVVIAVIDQRIGRRSVDFVAIAESVAIGITEDRIRVQCEFLLVEQAIAVLEQGSIIEYGSHEDLVAANGVYADLCRKQLLEEELSRDE